MKVIQTIAGIRSDHGGPSRSVPALCHALAMCGVDVHLVTSTPEDVSSTKNIPMSPVVSHLAAKTGRFKGFSRYKEFLKALEFAQSSGLQKEFPQHYETIVHDHGVWLPSNHAVAKFSSRQKLKRVISPRGMLSAWSLNHRRFKKQIAWYAYQKADLQSATAFHVTAVHEAEEVRALGMIQPIAIIPNGITFPEKPAIRHRPVGLRRMLFLSRIHPKKGLLELLRAWNISGISSNWELVIAGPDEDGYRQQIEREIANLNLEDRISFAGSIADTDKWQAYADADAFVLPSFSENFGIVVAEALAAGLPVITTTGTPWKQLGDQGCGWCIEPTVEELTNVLGAISKLSSSELMEMGQRGANWVSTEFTWKAVAESMIAFYSWLENGSDLPSNVMLD